MININIPVEEGTTGRTEQARAGLGYCHHPVPRLRFVYRCAISSSNSPISKAFPLHYCCSEDPEAVSLLILVSLQFSAASRSPIWEPEIRKARALI